MSASSRYMVTQHAILGHVKGIAFALSFLAVTCAWGQPEQWSVIHSSELALFDIHFTDLQHGIATSTWPPVSVYKTVDGGFTWQPLIMWVDFFPDADGIEFYNERIGHLINGSRTATTSDGGETWTIHYHGLPVSVNKVAYIDSLKLVAVGNLFWGPDSNLRSIYRSTDGGENWSTVYQEIGIVGFNHVVSLSESLQVTSGGPREIWRSHDLGQTWSLDAYSSNYITDMCSPAPNTIVASGYTLPGSNGYHPAISRSTDGGLIWTNVYNDTSLRATILWHVDFPDSSHGWAVGDDGMVAETDDGGDSWEVYFLDSVNSSLSSVCFVDSANGWAVDPPLGGTRVFRFGTPNSAIETQPYASTGVEIFPNYPNPFNSFTNIRFSLPATGYVRSVVYDLAGREVTQLHNGPLMAGSHELTWHPETLASGMYFCRIEWNHSERQFLKLLYLK